MVGAFPLAEETIMNAPPPLAVLDPLSRAVPDPVAETVAFSRTVPLKIPSSD